LNSLNLKLARLRSCHIAYRRERTLIFWLNNRLFRNHLCDARSCDTATRPLFYRTIRSSKGSKNHERQRARTARKVFSLVRLRQTSHKGIFYLCDTYNFFFGYTHRYKKLILNEHYNNKIHTIIINSI